jgi:hypothetical protein
VPSPAGRSGSAGAVELLVAIALSNALAGTVGAAAAAVDVVDTAGEDAAFVSQGFGLGGRDDMGVSECRSVLSSARVTLSLSLWVLSSSLSPSSSSLLMQKEGK